MLYLPKQAYIPNANRPTWTAHTEQIREMLGLGRKGKLPAHALMPLDLQGTNGAGEQVGITVWVNPPVVHNRRKSSTHRIMCKCPYCDKTLSLGRLAQHTCAAYDNRHEDDGERVTRAY